MVVLYAVWFGCPALGIVAGIMAALSGTEHPFSVGMKVTRWAFVFALVITFGYMKFTEAPHP
jgi:hypothetical protein